MAAGEVFVMINGEIDLSIGAVYLFTPFVFYKLSVNVGLPLIPAMIGALIVSMLVGLFNGVVDRLRRDRFVRGDARHVVHAWTA